MRRLIRIRMEQGLMLVAMGTGLVLSGAVMIVSAPFRAYIVGDLTLAE